GVAIHDACAVLTIGGFADRLTVGTAIAHRTLIAARPSEREGARALVVAVDVFASLAVTRIGLTVGHDHLARLASSIGRAFAVEAVHLVDALAFDAAVGIAIVDIVLAVVSVIPRGAVTRVLGNPVDALAVVQPRVGITIVDIVFAVLSVVALGAVTTVVGDIVDAFADVLIGV